MNTLMRKKFLLTSNIQRKARLLAIASDPTRLRIFCFMFEHKQACVSDIATGLGMSISAISHHLQIMRDNGLFITERMGTKICYILVNQEFTRKLNAIICAK